MQAIAEYITAITEAKKPKPVGRKRNPVKIAEKIDALSAELSQETSPMRRIELAEEIIQTQNDYNRLMYAQKYADPTAFEKDFITEVKSWAEEHQVSRDAFALLGVPATILDQAKL